MKKKSIFIKIPEIAEIKFTYSEKATKFEKSLPLRVEWEHFQIFWPIQNI